MKHLEGGTTPRVSFRLVLVLFFLSLLFFPSASSLISATRAMPLFPPPPPPPSQPPTNTPTPTPSPTPTRTPTATPTSTATRTPTPTKTPTRTPTPASMGGNLRITYIQYSGRDEYVEIHNDGPGDQPMAGWTLVSVVGNQVYHFPSDFTLRAGASVRVHSGRDAYESWPTDLKWTTKYIWNNGGDKAELRDASGRVVDSECWGSGCP